jgi:hypothetical protein
MPFGAVLTHERINGADDAMAFIRSGLVRLR